MLKWSQSLTVTDNVGRGFILCSTLPAQWAIRHPQVKVPAQVLCPVRSPVTTLDFILLKDRRLNFIPQQGPEISSQACRWVLLRFCQRLRCWFPNQQLILFLKSCLETPKAGFGFTNPEVELLLASSSAVSLPLLHAQGPACRAEISLMPPDIVKPMGTLF
jgi:hypothetical protein